VGLRWRRIDSLFGALRIKRHYYHCRACRRGHFPWDAVLGLNAHHLTPAAAELASMAGVQTSFAQASETTLRRMAGLKLSESTVERVTESTGERLAKLLEEKVVFDPNCKPWEWQRDALGRRCAYVGADAISVRQQGEHGAAAEGRMAYVGLLYNPRSPHDEDRVPPHQVRFLAGFYTLDDLGRQLRRQAGQVGWDDAEQQIALSDGGAGLEDFFRKNFPRAVCILDFWHAKEHLVELAKALFPQDEAERGQWLDDYCHELKHSGGQTVLEHLEKLDVSSRGAAVQETHRQQLVYFRNHAHHMDYPRYVANGWQIGSGPVESACKTVVANRLKGAGMRWGKPGSDNVCHLRALCLSEPGQWAAFWRDYPN
jgi:hypothetical protein